ncbi:MAG: hypothetical protein MUF34_19610 [Polyangiaceae bacterium]|jgi:hypothetical protein|nr:hypothetical protein [Polyangiaceae bacterium]
MSNVSALKARPSTAQRQARRPHLTVVPTPKPAGDQWERLRRRLVESALDVATTFRDAKLAMRALELRDLHDGDTYETRALALVELYESLCEIGANQARMIVNFSHYLLEPNAKRLCGGRLAKPALAMDLCARACRMLDKAGAK